VSVRRRIQYLVAGFVVLATVLGALAVQTVTQRDAALREIDGVVEPGRQQLHLLFVASADQQAGLRGYLLTRDERFLETYEAGSADAERAAVELDRILADHEDLRALLTRTRDAAAAWRDQAARPQLELAAAGAWDDAARLVATGDGTRRMEGVRA
jgi:CHASE3 domain sensor protein